MGDENILRSFMVKLGFDVDGQQQRRFTRTVKDTTENIVGMKTALTAAVAAAGTGLVRMSSDFEQVYYAAKRTGSQAKNLEAFGYAASQLGSSTQQATQAAEGLATQIRENPGKEDMLSRLGVQTRDANGNLRSTPKLLMGLGKQLSQMPINKAEAFSKSLNIPENLMLALRSGRYRKYFEQYRKTMKAVNYQKLTRDGHRFMQQLRLMRLELYSIGDQAVQSIEKDLGVNLKDINAWLQQHGPQIAKKLATWTSDITSWGQSAIGVFKELNKATNGWVGKLTAAYVAWRTLRKVPLLGTLIKGGEHVAKGATKTAAKAATGSGEAAGAADAAGTATAGKAATAAGSDASLLGRVLRVGGRVVSKASVPLDVGYSMFGSLHGSTLSDSQKQASRKRYVAHELKNLGVDRVHRAAMMANIQAESGYRAHGKVGDHGLARGYLQWHPARQKRFEDWSKQKFGHSIDFKKATPKQELQFMVHESRKGAERHNAQGFWNAKTAANASRAFTSKVVRPHDPTGSVANQRAATAQTIYNHQDVHITIHGGDAHHTAETVKKHLDQQTQGVARNARGVAG